MNKQVWSLVLMVLSIVIAIGGFGSLYEKEGGVEVMLQVFLRVFVPMGAAIWFAHVFNIHSTAPGGARRVARSAVQF